MIFLVLDFQFRPIIKREIKCSPLDSVLFHIFPRLARRQFDYIKVCDPVTCLQFTSFSEDEVQELEQWGTAMNLPNLNQALKHCIAYTIKHAKPNGKGQR